MRTIFLFVSLHAQLLKDSFCIDCTPKIFKMVRYNLEYFRLLEFLFLISRFVKSLNMGHILFLGSFLDYKFMICVDYILLG